MNKTIANLLFGLVIIAATILVFYRAVTLSLTHDEAASWLFTYDQFVPPSLFDTNAWGTANNHYLNSLGIEFFTSLFGYQEWVIRLPNVLAFVLYCSAGIALIRKLYLYQTTRIIGLIFLLCNPYVIDFFSLARGYGLSMGFHVAALYYLFLWSQDQKNTALIGMYSMLILATLSLFTHAIFLPIFTLVVWIYNWRVKKFSDKWVIIIPIIATLCTTALLYIPMSTLIHNSEFRWGTSSLSQSFTRFMKDSLGGRYYLGPNTMKIAGAMLIALIIAGSFRIILKKTDRKLQINYQILLYLIGGGLVISLLAAHYIMGSMYPEGRKSTLYWPLLTLLLPYAIELINNKNGRMLFGLVLGGVLLSNFYGRLEIDRTREWYYDYQTRENIEFIERTHPTEEITLATEWWFYWSTNYYIISRKMKNIKLSPYSKELRLNETFNYFLANEHTYDQLKDRYEIVRGPDISRVILLKSQTD